MTSLFLVADVTSNVAVTKVISSIIVNSLHFLDLKVKKKNLFKNVFNSSNISVLKKALKFALFLQIIKYL